MKLGGTTENKAIRPILQDRIAFNIIKVDNWNQVYNIIEKIKEENK